MDEPEILPCPFYKHDGDDTPRLSYSFATMHNDENPEEPIHQTRFHVFCPACGAIGPERLSQEAAIESWNTRYEKVCEYEIDQLPEGGTVFSTCTNCGWQTDVDYIPMPEGFKYCPNCGAMVVR